MAFGGIGGALASGALSFAGLDRSTSQSIGGLFGAGIDYLTRDKPKKLSGIGGAPAQPSDLTNFSGMRPNAPPSGPAFIQGSGGLVPGMTDIQQRSKVATEATQGSSSAYRDPATLDYYRNLALHSLTDPSGAVRADSIVLPIERQYLTDILGQQPKDESVAAFLSALLRS